MTELNNLPPKKHLGIPEAVFIEDVDVYMKENEESNSKSVLQKLDENYQKYKLMEVNLLQKKRRLQLQIPELKSTLEIVRYLHENKKETTDSASFLLSGGLHAKASIPPTNEVYLWLGANVMLSYPTGEALDLLTKNSTSATKTLAAVNEDLDYLRDQITTTEVTMARMYNWDVKQRKKPST